MVGLESANPEDEGSRQGPPPHAPWSPHAAGPHDRAIGNGTHTPTPEKSPKPGVAASQVTGSLPTGLPGAVGWLSFVYVPLGLDLFIVDSEPPRPEGGNLYIRALITCS